MSDVLAVRSLRGTFYLMNVTGRRRQLKIRATWPWANAITAAWERIDALPQAPDLHEPVPAIQEGEPPGPWNPGHPARQPGCCYTRTLKSGVQNAPRTPASASHQPL